MGRIEDIDYTCNMCKKTSKIGNMYQNPKSDLFDMMYAFIPRQVQETRKYATCIKLFRL